MQPTFDSSRTTTKSSSIVFPDEGSLPPPPPFTRSVHIYPSGAKRGNRYPIPLEGLITCEQAEADTEHSTSSLNIDRSSPFASNKDPSPSLLQKSNSESQMTPSSGTVDAQPFESAERKASENATTLKHPVKYIPPVPFKPESLKLASFPHRDPSSTAPQKPPPPSPLPKPKHLVNKKPPPPPPPQEKKV